MDNTKPGPNPFPSGVPGPGGTAPMSPGGPVGGPPGSPFGRPKEDEDFSFDMTGMDTDSTSRFVIPAGYYIGKCIDVKKDTSKAGNPMWVWTFVIIHGEQAGKEFKLWTALTPSAAWKVAETLEALDLGKGGSLANFKKSDALNRRCIMVIVDDTNDKGKPTSSLDRIMAHPDGPVAA